MEASSQCDRYFSDNCSKRESMEMSSLHKTLIRTSWKRISIEFSKTNASGPTETFIKMFEKYPESRNFFTKFKDTQKEEFESNSELLKDLKAHSVRVFQLVEKVIMNMDHNLEKVGFI